MQVETIEIIACCRSGHNFIINQIKSWTDNNVLNLEDLRPINYKISEDCKTIIVIRDLLNWWASYLKWITKDGIDNYLVSKDKLNNAFSIWSDQVKEAFSITNYIPDKIIVNYDTFHKSKAFRQSICKSIGGNYNEKRINEVVASGGGSSFDKQAVSGTKLKTCVRYKQILNSELKELYLDTLDQNKEIIDIYNKHFELTKSKLNIIQCQEQ